MNIEIAVTNISDGKVFIVSVPLSSNVMHLKKIIHENHMKDTPVSNVHVIDEKNYELDDSQPMSPTMQALTILTYETPKKRKVIDLTKDENKAQPRINSGFSRQPQHKRMKSVNRWFDGKRYFLNKIPGPFENRAPEHVIDISEIFSFSNRPKSIYLSSYCADPGFLLSDIITRAPTTCRICLTKHWTPNGIGADKEKRQLIKCGSFVGIHPKRSFRYTSVHAKLWLVEFEDRIRVVVTSANLTSHDFRSYSQTFWIQDFPLKRSNQVYSHPSQFETDLKLMLSSLADFERNRNAPETIHLTTLLDRFDFSGAQGQLIVSIPGIYKSSDGKMNKYGLFSVEEKLRLCVKNFYERNERRRLDDVKVERIRNSSNVWIQTSTVGRMNKNNVSYFARKMLANKIGLIFPSRRAVNNSLYGMNGAGMMFFSKKTYDTKTFPKDIFHDFDVNYQNSQKGLLSHSKIVLCPDVMLEVSYRQPQQQRRVEKKRMMWTIVGSHNFTKAAWGGPELQERQCKVNNYELGVILVKEFEGFDDSQKVWPHVCKCPPRPYTKADVPFFSS